MAAEYSRELSVKVLAGLCRRASLGFHVGTATNLGLRRVVIGFDGVAKGEFPPGQHKPLQSDHYTLVPGPPEEIKTVNRIFTLLTEGDLTITEIVHILNSDGSSRGDGRCWTFAAVKNLLTNECYIGNNVYNRRKSFLGDFKGLNPPDRLVRVEGAFEAIVPLATFKRAQEIFDKRRRAKRISEAEMLEALKSLYKRKGALSHRIINEDPKTPSSKTYKVVFGSVYAAYELIGYKPLPRWQTSLDLQRRLRAKIRAGLEGRGYQIKPFNRTSLLIAGYGPLTVRVTHCRTTPRANIWHAKLNARLPALTVLARFSADGASIKDYLFLPPGAAQSTVFREDHSSLEPFRHINLDDLFDLFPPVIEVQ
jgi:hypothetical protein